MGVCKIVAAYLAAHPFYSIAAEWRGESGAIILNAPMEIHNKKLCLFLPYYGYIKMVRSSI